MKIILYTLSEDIVKIKCPDGRTFHRKGLSRQYIDLYSSPYEEFVYDLDRLITKNNLLETYWFDSRN